MALTCAAVQGQWPERPGRLRSDFAFQRSTNDADGQQAIPDMNPVRVTRTAVRFAPDPHRVITKTFLPGEHIFPDGQSRAELVIRRILAMPPSGSR